MSRMTAEQWTLSRLSVELNRDRRTLGRLISQHRVVPAGKSRWGDTYRLRDIVEAMLADVARPAVEEGTFDEERTRKTRVERELLEMEKARLEGELLPAVEVGRAWEAVVVGIRQKILHAPISDAVKDEMLVELVALNDTGNRDTEGSGPSAHQSDA